MKMRKYLIFAKCARVLGATALLLFVSWPRSTCFPASSKEEIPSISFDQFPYAIKRFYFFSYVGTPVSEAKEMNGPGPGDFPPHLVVFLEDPRRYPSLEKGGRYMMPAQNVVRVYNISAATIAPYKTIQTDIKRLRELLKLAQKQCDQGEAKNTRAATPRNAGHLVQVKMHYSDASWGSGLFYITQFVQGRGEWPDNERLVYLFQGLSKDERFYISADFRVTHSALEGAEPRSHQLIHGYMSKDSEAEADALTEKLSSIMAKDRDEAFTPPLNKIRDWVSSFKIQ